MAEALEKYRKRALSVDEFCYQHNVGKTLTYREMANGRLRSIKIGRKRLIPSDAAEAWFSSFNSPRNPDDTHEGSPGEASRSA